MAKAPEPGQVKTRLCPPCTPTQAAALAAAALADTLAAAMASGADRVVVALDGPPGDWLPPGCTVVRQRGVGLPRRLANAWADVGGPGVQVGMDTPQVTSALLDRALTSLDRAPAALGLAVDGGWWALGLRLADRRVFAGIATSRPDTGARQLARLHALGLDPAALPVLRDVDRFDDAVVVADAAPGTAFATAVAAWRDNGLAVGRGPC